MSKEKLDWSVPEVGGSTYSNGIRTHRIHDTWSRSVCNDDGSVSFCNSEGKFIYPEYDSSGKLIAEVSDLGRKEILACDSYVLYFCDKRCLFIAGCRRFTWRQALNHWNDYHFCSRRADRFNVAIQNKMVGKNLFEQFRMLVVGKFYQWKMRNVVY
jgi:hypothetical protein